MTAINVYLSVSDSDNPTRDLYRVRADLTTRIYEEYNFIKSDWRELIRTLPEWIELPENSQISFIVNGDEHSCFSKSHYDQELNGAKERCGSTQFDIDVNLTAREFLDALEGSLRFNHCKYLGAVGLSKTNAITRPDGSNFYTDEIPTVLTTDIFYSMEQGRSNEFAETGKFELLSVPRDAVKRVPIKNGNWRRDVYFVPKYDIIFYESPIDISVSENPDVEKIKGSHGLMAGWLSYIRDAEYHDIIAMAEIDYVEIRDGHYCFVLYDGNAIETKIPETDLAAKEFIRATIGKSVRV